MKGEKSMKKYKVSFVRIVEADDEYEAISEALRDSSIPDTQDIYSDFYVEEIEDYE